MTTNQGDPLDRLRSTVDELLDPPGCEWNRSQTHETLVTYLVEETFELVEAIEDGTAVDLREELGDVLYQVVLHAAIAERSGEGFGLDQVIADADDKTRRRHPHVFGSDHADGVDDIVRLWSEAKAREKASRKSAFDGVPLGLPALARAQKIESRRVSAKPEEQSGGCTPPALDEAATEAEWGLALLAEVDRAGTRGWDAERALRGAVRAREAALREAETAAREAETAAREAETTPREAETPQHEQK